MNNNLARYKIGASHTFYYALETFSFRCYKRQGTRNKKKSITKFKNSNGADLRDWKIENWNLELFCILFLVSCLFITSCAQKSDQVCLRNKCFDVEIVDQPKDMARGLQFRPALAKNAGMLFVFPRSDVNKFWMKDTWIPLDMIWLNEDKEIVDIATNVPPCKEDPCPSYGANVFSRYVLEVNAGDAEHLGLIIGDQARFRGSASSL